MRGGFQDHEANSHCPSTIYQHAAPPYSARCRTYSHGLIEVRAGAPRYADNTLPASSHCHCLQTNPQQSTAAAMASSITSYGSLKAHHGHIYYEQEGNKSGHSVLFIHGLGGTTNTYQPLISSLQDFNLVRFDWAGHGRSTLPQKTSIDSYVEDAQGKMSGQVRRIMWNS